MKAAKQAMSVLPGLWKQGMISTQNQMGIMTTELSPPAIAFAAYAGFSVDSAYYYCYEDIPDEYKTNGKEYVGLEATRP